MSESYGKTIGLALKAVRQMHSDTSKLLRDCDDTIGKGRASIWGNTATKDLTRHVTATQWMAEGVFRYYDATASLPGLVEGVMACFIEDSAPEKLAEPLLVVGQIGYRLVEGQSLTAVCDTWDLWHAVMKWSTERPYEKVLTPTAPPARPVEWIKLVAAPLYSVKGMATVVALMEQVRQASRP